MARVLIGLPPCWWFPLPGGGLTRAVFSPKRGGSEVGALAVSAGVFDCAGLPDDGDLDLARVLELLLDLAGDLVAEQRHPVVVDRVGRDHDPDLAAGLH